MEGYKYSVYHFDLVYDNSGKVVNLTNISEQSFITYCKTDNVFICNKVQEQFLFDRIQ